MKLLLVSGKIGLIETDNKGRCLIAMENILENEIIIKDPVIVFREEEIAIRNKTFDYSYIWNKEKNERAFSCGLGTFLNHSYEPNSKELFDYDNSMDIIWACREIKKGEEITINYSSIFEEDIFYTVKKPLYVNVDLILNKNIANV